MTATSKKKEVRKNAAAFKTKLTKKKVLSAKKDKDMKKKKNKVDGKKKKDKVIETKGKKFLGKQTKKKSKGGKKKVKGKQREKDMEEAGPEMASLNQTTEETNGDEFEQEEVITEEGDVATADDSKEITSVSEERDMSSDDDGDDDAGEEEEDEGYVEPVSKEVPNETTDAAGKSQVKKHVVFDDDETFENLPVIASDAGRKSPVEDPGDSDSDAPPEEESISMGKDIFEEDNVKMKEEIMKLKKQVKEARRLKHEKNREQQQKKRERLQKLEETRLPADLLDAVAMEEKEGKKTKSISIAEPKGKRKTFDEDDDLSDTELFSEAVDDEGLITLDRGVKVRTVKQQLKKSKTIASIAADFRQKAIYNRKFPRMSSVAQRQMLVKQQKSGKNSLAS